MAGIYPDAHAATSRASAREWTPLSGRTHQPPGPIPRRTRPMVSEANGTPSQRAASRRRGMRRHASAWRRASPGSPKASQASLATACARPRASAGATGLRAASTASAASAAVAADHGSMRQPATASARATARSPGPKRSESEVRHASCSTSKLPASCWMDGWSVMIGRRSRCLRRTRASARARRRDAAATHCAAATRGSKATPNTGSACATPSARLASIRSVYERAARTMPNRGMRPCVQSETTPCAIAARQSCSASLRALPANHASDRARRSCCRSASAPSSKPATSPASA